VPKGVLVMTHFDEAITALGELVRMGRLQPKSFNSRGL